MKKIKQSLILLSAFFLVACTDSQNAGYYNEETEQTTTESSQVQDSADVNEDENEEETDGEEVADQEESTTGKVVSTSKSKSTSGQSSVAGASSYSQQAGPQGEIIQKIVSRDPELDPKKENYDYLLTEEQPGLYQLEVRLDNADGTVGNLIGIYRYDEASDIVSKMDMLTGLFEELKAE